MIERRDLPLFAWGDALRHARRRRIRLRRRAMLIGAGIACVLATLVVPPVPRLVWNLSASAPRGLYRVYPKTTVSVGDMVIARLPAEPRALAAGRHYLPANVPLVKRVVAGPGDRICALGHTITVGRHAVALRRDVDAMGRVMPWWNGCRHLHAGEIFLVMAASANSFDGRYFGPSRVQDVVGKAIPLWVW